MALYEADQQTQNVTTQAGIDITLGFKLPDGTVMCQPPGAVYLQTETEWLLSLSNLSLVRWKIVVEIDGKALPELIFHGYKDELDFNPTTQNRFKFVARTQQNDQYFGVTGKTGKVIVKCYKEMPQAMSFGGYDPFSGGTMRGGEVTRSLGGRTVGGSQSDRQLGVAAPGTYSSTPVTFTFDLKVDPRFPLATHEQPKVVVCRHCRAVNTPGRDNCWRCGGTLNK